MLVTQQRNFAENSIPSVLRPFSSVSFLLNASVDDYTSSSGIEVKEMTDLSAVTKHVLAIFDPRFGGVDCRSTITICSGRMFSKQ
jgi:hypothetical protein